MSLLNRSAVRERILREFAVTRPDAGVVRVSPQAITDLERKFENMVILAVQCHPSLGKTFTEVL